MRKYYKYYFLSLASADLQIAHTVDQKAFFFIKDIYNPDAFDNAVRSAGKSPCLLLENYRTKLTDGNNRNYFKHLYGRFNILTNVETGNDDSIEAAQELCEDIAEDLLAKMREGLQEGSTIEINADNISKKVFFPMQEIEIDPIGPISSNYYGVSVSFYWKTPGKGSSNPLNWPVL